MLSYCVKTTKLSIKQKTVRGSLGKPVSHTKDKSNSNTVIPTGVQKTGVVGKLAIFDLFYNTHENQSVLLNYQDDFNCTIQDNTFDDKNTTQQQPFYGPLSGTTWVSRYQK